MSIKVLIYMYMQLWNHIKARGHVHAGHNFYGSLTLALIGVFALWWFNPAHIPHNFAGAWHIFDVLLFAGVSFVIWHPLIMDMMAWAIASNIKPLRSAAPQPGLRVAFVTTFVPASESIDLLRKTLPAMVNADYPHDTWLLDEGDDPAARELCQQYGVRHFSRKDRGRFSAPEGKYAAGTKGGNHNSWYDTFGNGYDIVAQIDTDFIPRRDFLTQTLGHFRDERVAFVGTPQIYGNTESLIARGAAEQTYSFYGPILRGLFGMEMTLLIGANHVIRVAALKDVHHYSAHITEDLLTGMKLHARGWKSLYVSEPLAIGEGPSSWGAYFNQQMRWAFGCMDILLRHTPRLLKDMNWRQRLYYFLLQQHYFSGLAMFVGFALLMLYFGLGLTSADMTLGPMLSVYVPVLLATQFLNLWLQRYNVRPKTERGMLWAGRLVSVAAWPVFFMAFVGALRGKRMKYKVTPKGGAALGGDATDGIELFYPHILIGLLCLAGLISVPLTGRTADIMAFWAAITASLMLGVPFGMALGQVWSSIKRSVIQRVPRLQASTK